MLHTSTPIIINILLDLRFLLPWSWLIDGHLDSLLIVGHDHGPQGRVVGVHLRVIHRPEPVEQEVPLVPCSSVLHLQVRLVPHHVVYEVDPCRWEAREEKVLVERILVSW